VSSILPTPSTGPLTRSRGRRSARPSGESRELAILATAERLLSERPLAEISIDDLAQGAGISRSGFYFYFQSKEAVLLALLDRIVAEAQAMAAEAHAEADRAFASGSRDPAKEWRRAIGASFEAYRRNRGVALAAVQVKATNPEVKKLWAAIMENWVQRTTAAIEAERRRGNAPPGMPARALATLLDQMAERAMFATFTDEQPALAESDLVEALLQIWLRSIYLIAEAPQAAPPTE